MIWERFFGKKLRPTAPHVQAVAVHNTPTWPNLAEQSAQSDVYARSAWVYVAVNKIAEAAALVPLAVYRRVDGDDIAIPDHPLTRLLDNPNPYMSRFELFEQTVGTLELTGNAYWYLMGDESGRPSEIWPLRPDRVSIVPHKTRYVAGYIYELGGQRIPLQPAEVVHFKRWHPTNDYYGLSALQAARLAVQTDRAMSEWNRATFGQNNGVPAGIVNIKEFVSDEDFERIKREWRASYGGVQRRTAFLRGGAVDWHDIGLNHRDMDFLQGRQANREEILNVFGVPVGLVSDNATEANAIVAERTFVERTLWPKLARIAAKLTQELSPFYGGGLSLAFDDIRPTDQRLRLDEIRAAQAVMSINEIRERYYHMPPVDWGDRPSASPPATEPAPPSDEPPPNSSSPHSTS
ncbi:MAG: phage portal protein [Anaerolineaceae bacterium]|nr:MAG: phage portal protein [Anaerolineaceae bacterium]